jgi:hypothetical protein
MRTSAACLCVVALAGVGCGGGADGSAAPDPLPAATIADGAMSKAEDDFWDAFLAGNVGAVPAARTEMLAAFDPTSADYEGARFIGMSYMLSIAEGGGAPKGAPPGLGGAPPMLPSFVLDNFTNAAKYTTLAANLAPKSDGVIDLGHEADAVYTEGQVTRDPELVDKAKSLLSSVVIPAYPIYGYLTEAPVFVAQPAGSADFAAGLESLFLLVEACTGSHVDRDNPDVSGMLGNVRDPDCGNGKAHIPHNLEGTLLMFGDSLAKAGKPDAALPVYETVTKTADYTEWAFRSIIESRLSANLDALAAAYQGSDPPAIGSPTHPCLQCHER